ncbi:hypothetical protein LFL96_01660 [Paraburkholderia sp. D15]|nr:hypothetical protein [Paraburkholderia sp. D15]WGS50243.1 hypothetical protein LFL96_01660 [Paraburkholderia sp. D15]WKF58123.1 hypothetical protein HUO10_002620 [Paraburkholderia busanensis]
MPNLIDYVIENRAMRDRFIDAMVPFSLVGGTIYFSFIFLVRIYS